MSAPTLTRAPARPATLLVRGAHVVDPVARIDALHDVLVRDGEIAEIGAPGTLDAGPGAEVVDGTGKHLLPAFVDPHVHLRTPGQEHKEDLETGTRAAAAGGFCAILGMANTDPVVDTAPILGALLEAAARDARIPVGFMACVTRGMDGQDLTEMAELADVGAFGFTDDGRPIADAGVMRRALQYQRLPAASSRCTRRTCRCPAPARCTRARSAPASASRGSRASRSPRSSRATASSPATRTPASTCST